MLSTANQQQDPPPPPPPPADMTAADPTYFLEKYPLRHLGLQLRKVVEPSTAYVIDQIQRPTAN